MWLVKSGDWFCFFPLIVIAAPAYTCAEEQLMLSAMMKIVAFPHTVGYAVPQMKTCYRNSSAKETKKQ